VSTATCLKFVSNLGGMGVDVVSLVSSGADIGTHGKSFRHLTTGA
jgi:hypothetical protein